MFKPKTFVEKALVDQLVGDLWTLRRLARAENFLYKNTGAEVERDLLKAPTKLKVISAKHDGTLKQLESEIEMQGEAARRAIKSWPAPIFEHLYFDESNQGALERIAALKSKLLNSILSIERELRRRRDEV